MTTKGDKTSAAKLSATIKACRNILRKDKGLSSDIERIPN